MGVDHAIAADRNRPRKHLERARIVLASAERHSAQQVAQSIGVSRPTVWRWQQRFAESGVDGLLRDKTRKPGKAPIASEKTAQVVALTCTAPPHEANRWTGRDGQGERPVARFGAALSGEPNPQTLS
jgi:transposase